MLHAEELRIGNRVFWKPKFLLSNTLLQIEITSIEEGKAGYIRSHLEHRVEPFEDDMITKETPYATFEELAPIPLNDLFPERLNTKIKYPEWIQYIHELQNWYYWNNEKKELEIND